MLWSVQELPVELFPCHTLACSHMFSRAQGVLCDLQQQQGWWVLFDSVTICWNAATAKCMVSTWECTSYDNLVVPCYHGNWIIYWNSTEETYYYSTIWLSLHSSVGEPYTTDVGVLTIHPLRQCIVALEGLVSTSWRQWLICAGLQQWCNDAFVHTVRWLCTSDTYHIT